MEQERCETCGQWVKTGNTYYNENNDRAECEVCAFK